jgi:hypothetical protein
VSSEQQEIKLILKWNEINNYELVLIPTSLHSGHVTAKSRYCHISDHSVARSPATTGRRCNLLKIFNILGEEVAALISDRLSDGSYPYEWDASNLASGVYAYRLQAGDFIEMRKMVLMRKVI